MVKPLVVYRASAGSGKTFTLAVEYIKLLVQNPLAYKQTLAVTFTNKATEEMKMRILSQLYGIWRGLESSKAYQEKICQELEASPEFVSRQAGTALHLLLHNYNYFRVETIDSFFQSVLRNLARELDLTANLRVGLNDVQVEEVAVDQLIDSLKATDQMLQWLLRYIMDNISDDKRNEEKRDTNFYFKQLKAGNRQQALEALCRKYFGKDLRQAEEAAISKKEIVNDAKSLLSGMMVGSMSKDNIWINPNMFDAPGLLLSGQPVNGYNQLMMALHRDLNEFTSGKYVSFNDASKNGISVLRGQQHLPFNWIKTKEYVNKYDNSTISINDYKALSDDDKKLFRAVRETEVLKLFNLDQTTFGIKHPEELNDNTAQVETIPYRDMIMSEFADKTVIFSDHGDMLVIGDENIEQVSNALNGKVNYDLDERSRFALGVGGKVLMFSRRELSEAQDQFIKAGMNVGFCDYHDVEVRKDFAERMSAISSQCDQMIKKITGTDSKHVVEGPMVNVGYDTKSGTLKYNKVDWRENSDPLYGSIEKTSEVLRSISAYLGAAERLNRHTGDSLLPDDKENYSHLIDDLSAGVMMMRAGLPGVLSMQTMVRMNYWAHEFNENKSLMQYIERDINSTVEAMTKLSRGESVNYNVLRNENFCGELEPEFYSIASYLQTVPDEEMSQVVVVRDQKDKTASVILPLPCCENNENNIDKKLFAVALQKEGIDDVHFFYTNGASALNQPNSYFKGKDVDVCMVTSDGIKTVDSLDFSEELEPSNEVEIEYMDMIPSSNGKFVAYIKPVGESAVMTPARPDDAELFRDTYKNHPEDLASVRESLGKTYYNILSKHPELNVDILMPTELNVPIGKISNVNMRQNEDKQWCLYADIDGKEQQPVGLNKNVTERFWLVEDKELFKLRLAANAFAKELGVSEGRVPAPFPDITEGEGVNGGKDSKDHQSGAGVNTDDVRGGVKMSL